MNLHKFCSLQIFLSDEVLHSSEKDVLFADYFVNIS